MSSDIINKTIQFALQAKETASAQLVILILEDQQTQSTIAAKLWREKMEIVKPDLISSSVTMKNLVVTEFGGEETSWIQPHPPSANRETWHPKLALSKPSKGMHLSNYYKMTNSQYSFQNFTPLWNLLLNVCNILPSKHPKSTDCHQNPELHIKSCLLSNPTKFGPGSTWFLSQVVHIQLPMFKNLVKPLNWVGSKFVD